jgi:hypothetical protein
MFLNFIISKNIEFSCNKIINVLKNSKEKEKERFWWSKGWCIDSIKEIKNWIIRPMNTISIHF